LLSKFCHRFCILITSVPIFCILITSVPIWGSFTTSICFSKKKSFSFRVIFFCFYDFLFWQIWELGSEFDNWTIPQIQRARACARFPWGLFKLNRETERVLGINMISRLPWLRGMFFHS
jgi:hypothetical protein